MLSVCMVHGKRIRKQSLLEITTCTYMYNSFLYTCNQELSKGKNIYIHGFFLATAILIESQCCVIHKLVYMYKE